MGPEEAESSVVSVSGSLEVSVAQPRAAWGSTATFHGGARRQRAGSYLPVPITNWFRAGPEGRSVPRAQAVGSHRQSAGVLGQERQVRLSESTPGPRCRYWCRSEEGLGTCGRSREPRRVPCHSF